MQGHRLLFAFSISSLLKTKSQKRSIMKTASSSVLFHLKLLRPFFETKGKVLQIQTTDVPFYEVLVGKFVRLSHEQPKQKTKKPVAF